MSNRTKIKKIRTGGQTGVDRAAMDFAREHDIPLCGWCPKGGWAEDYPNPPGLLMDYPELTETPSADPAQRTKWNMRDSDAILTIIPAESMHSPGTDVGLEEGRRLGKSMYTAAGLEDVPAILQWIKDLTEGADLSDGNNLHDGIELCVGGPRASECPEAYDITKSILEHMAQGIGLL